MFYILMSMVPEDERDRVQGPIHPVYGVIVIIYIKYMSKTSHTRHEHEAAGHHEATDDYGPTFAHKHRTLIIVVTVLFVLFAPIAFAIYWFSRFF